jgi:hypothetical protein
MRFSDGGGDYIDGGYAMGGDDDGYSGINSAPAAISDAGNHQHNLDIAPFNTAGAFDGNPEIETRPKNAYVWYIIRAR